MKRGEMYWAVLAPRSGSEQQGRRPVIVVSHDGFNQTPNWRSVIVCRSKQAERGPTCRAAAKGQRGIKEAKHRVVPQVPTLERGKLTRRIGALVPAAMQDLAAGLKAALDLA